MRQLILRDVQLLDDALVTLENLDGEPTLLLLRHVVENDLLDVRQRMLDAAREAMLRNGLLAGACQLHGTLSCLHHAVALERGNLNDRNAQMIGELCRVVRSPFLRTTSIMFSATPSECPALPTAWSDTGCAPDWSRR